MVGVHTLWSKPYFYKNSDKNFFLKDYDILVMLISLLKWKEKNGKIVLFADEFSRNLVKEYGIDKFYDEVRNLEIDDDIKPNIFWAAGKLFALKAMEKPCALIDIDLIIWEDISDFFKKYDIIGMHTEELLERTYKEKDYFYMEDTYKFPENLNWKKLPINTAMLYIKDMDFKEYFLEKSIEFMKKTKENCDSLSYMVFAEQRLLSMLADAKNIEIKTMLDFPDAIGNQKTFTHLWGYKTMLNESLEVRERFCLRCVRRIKTENIEYFNILKNIPSVIKYLNKI